jgi:hypothetical protein
MEKIDVTNAVKLIKSTKGKIFTVSFIKKDGSLRRMNCRLGVKKHLKGGEMAYDPSEYDLLPVFDLQNEAYRMINLETLKEITVDGETFSII